MSFASESGYTPQTVQELMTMVMAGVNTQFNTAYTTETFIGSNFYKYYYALIQKLQENEVKTAEIFLKIQDFFTITNERIARAGVTNPGIIEAFAKAGWVASVKKPIDADAGKIFIAVDVDNVAAGYAARKLAINTLVKNSTAGGIVSQGTEVNTIVLSNGQAFDFKFALPNRLTALLRLTITLSDNNQVVVKSPEEVKAILLAKIKSMYRLGRNFEPQKYFTTADAPWAKEVKLEWSTNGGTTWNSTVYTAAYNDLFMISLANTSVVEN